MKKLTAGIFTVLMGLVSVNAADAAVASKGYVDNKFFTKQAQTEHVAAQKAIDDAQDVNINKNTTDIATLNGDENTDGSVKKQIKGATDTITSAYQTADNALSERIDQLTGGGATKQELNEAIAAEVTRSNKYTDDAVAAEVTRANQAYDVKGAAATAQSAAEATAKSYTDAEVKELADGAVKNNADAIAAINNDANGVLATAKKYADDQDTAQTTAMKKYADDQDAAQTTAITTAYQAADAETLSSAKAYTNEKIGALDLRAISRVPAECGTAGNYCVLTTNGANFVWEVIVRDDTTLGEGDDGLYGEYPATDLSGI